MAQTLTHPIDPTEQPAWNFRGPSPWDYITQVFKGKNKHEGHDYGIPNGTPMHAAGVGVVVDVQFGWGGGWGNHVVIRYWDTNITIRYAHLLSNIPVRVGQAVDRFEVIGYSNNSGSSEGPHLHLETIENYVQGVSRGNPVDPFNVLVPIAVYNAHADPNNPPVIPSIPQEDDIMASLQEVIDGLMPHVNKKIEDEFTNFENRYKAYFERQLDLRLGTTMASDPRDHTVWNFQRPGNLRTYVEGPGQFDWLLFHNVPYVGDLEEAGVDVFRPYPEAVLDGITELWTPTIQVIEERKQAVEDVLTLSKDEQAALAVLAGNPEPR
jgi:hypothetical protein